MPHSPTPEQLEIISAASLPQSLMISAYAGCAKTSSLEMAANVIREPTLALAFNKKIATELSGRLPDNFTIRTLNAMGHRVWANSIKGMPIKLDDRKLGKLITQTAKEMKLNLLPGEWEGILATVNHAMMLGIVPNSEYWDREPMNPDTEDSWSIAADLAGFDSPNLELCREILRLNNELSKSGIISFNDQIYAPTCLGGNFPQYPRVMVDEAQDLSPLNHRMLELLCQKESGNLIAVGDPRQAIYQFRGADAQSMENLRRLKPEWMDLPLTLTFRCPKEIVARQQSHAPGFRAHESNKRGQIYYSLSTDPSGEENPDWTWSDVESIATSNDCQSLAILCRNNAPLMSLAFKLIRRGIGCEVAGRDIGKGLIAMTKKLSPDDGFPITKFESKLTEWQELEEAKALARDNPYRIDSIRDRAECLRATMDATQCRTVGELRAMLEMLFDGGKNGRKILLSSIHRAKGLEWDCIVHLDPWRIPSKMAKSPSEMEQEMNLLYVAETRTRNVLILANLGDFR